MDDRGKSDDPVVPAKPVNNAQGGAAESVEGRGSAEGNVASETRSGPRAGTSALSDLARVRRAARNGQGRAVHGALASRRCRSPAGGVLGDPPEGRAGGRRRDVADYGADLEANLQGLHDRVHAGRYRARPSRRVFIPKADGRLRPLGVAALEDKILQRAVVEVLNMIYEDGLSRVLVRVSPGTLPASRVGRAVGRDRAQEGELGARPGFPGVLHQP